MLAGYELQSARGFLVVDYRQYILFTHMTGKDLMKKNSSLSLITRNGIKSWIQIRKTFHNYQQNPNNILEIYASLKKKTGEKVSTKTLDHKTQEDCKLQLRKKNSIKTSIRISCHALLSFVQFINRENTFSKVADFSLTKQRKASYILIAGTTIPDGIFGTNPSFRAK